jgi:hypothetical protein
MQCGVARYVPELAQSRVSNRMATSCIAYLSATTFFILSTLLLQRSDALQLGRKVLDLATQMNLELEDIGGSTLANGDDVSAIIATDEEASAPESEDMAVTVRGWGP